MLGCTALRITLSLTHLLRRFLDDEAFGRTCISMSLSTGGKLRSLQLRHQHVLGIPIVVRLLAAIFTISNMLLQVFLKYEFIASIFDGTIYLNTAWTHQHFFVAIDWLVDGMRHTSILMLLVLLVLHHTFL